MALILSFTSVFVSAAGIVGQTAPDISVSELQSAGVSSSIQSQILSLPPEQRVKLKADLASLNGQIKATNAKWTAGYTPQMLLSSSEQAMLSGVSPPTGAELAALESRAKAAGSLAASGSVGASLPDSFDWRNRHGKNYITSSKDQGQCGSCWAFSAAGVLEGTINAYYNNPSLAPDLSEEDMITCYKANGCCGTAVNEIEILYGNYLKSGICSESCFGYSACDANTDQYHCPNQNNDGDTCTTTVSCSSKCPSTSSSWKISNYHRLALTVADLKKAIMTYGPIEVGMYLYDDFYSYRSGIYKHTAGAFRGGHAVTIVGWGTEARQNYWIAKNSWGPSWGEGGFFRIAQGDSYINSWFAFAAEQPLPVSASHPSPICEDADLDGYCNWGLGPKPANCAETCSDLEDPDDSNRLIPLTTTTTTSTTKTTRTTTTKTTRTTTTTIVPTCVDSDSGRDFYAAGSVTAVSARGKTIVFADTCHAKNIKSLYEGYCSAKNVTSKKLVACPNTCLDGVCVAGKEPVCARIGTAEEGWYQGGVIISAAKCEGCIARCSYPKKPALEGWYSSCAKALIKLEGCSSTGTTTTTTLAASCGLCTTVRCDNCISVGQTCFVKDGLTECFRSGAGQIEWTECTCSP